MDPTQSVISALKERNISPKRNEIASAFGDEVVTTKNTEWVKEHLYRDTLLSQEELSLYSKLESFGVLPSILYHADFESTRPLLDEDIRTAIGLLNASTAAIQRQTEIMTSQHELLKKQLRRDNERQAKQDRNVERLRQKHEAGRQNTAATASDLTHELETLLRNETEKATTDSKRILSALTTRLKDDDRILADLERLAAGAKSTDGDASVLKQTSELNTVLSRYVAEEIYFRLDRLYFEQVLAGQGPVNDQLTDLEQEALVGLEGELESLYPEIEILAKMSTKQQYIDPILRELQNHHGQLRIASHQKLDDILGFVTEMIAFTQSLTSTLENWESFCGTLESFASAYRSETGDQALDPATARRETMRRFSTQPISAAVLLGKRTGPFPESQALEGLLRRIGLPFESVFNSEEAYGGVNTLLKEREQRLNNFRNYGAASDSPLVAELIPSDQAIQLLSSSLNTNSNFTTSLSSPEHERSLAELESKLGYIQKGVERLNQNAVYQRDKGQERFVDKWG